jgi:uncharacterized protein
MNAPAVRVDDDVLLRRIVHYSPWLVSVLRTVRESGLPDAWVGAGAVRDLVWSELYGPGFDPAEVHDIDVVFFDPDDLSRQRDSAATEVLERIWTRHPEDWPRVPWQAKNQAAVHTWYAAKFGGEPIEPLRSIADAVATWPETATAVAVQVDDIDEVEVCAPLGLADLLDGVWRRNPRRVSLEQSQTRLSRHRPQERWPGVRVLPPA